MNGIEENIGAAVEDYIEKNPIDVDLTGYATENYVIELVEEIELTPGPKGEDGKDFTYDDFTAEQLAALKGEPGADGYTPIKGVDYFDGKDGEPGKDGYTPVKGVDYFDGEPGKDGAAGKDGYTPIKGVDYFDGAPGEPGKDGYTPVKGVDYFDGKDGANGSDYVLTEADKQEIAGMVDVPGGGGSGGGSSGAVYINWKYNLNNFAEEDREKLQTIVSYYIEHKEMPCSSLYFVNGAEAYLVAYITFGTSWDGNYSLCFSAAKIADSTFITKYYCSAYTDGQLKSCSSGGESLVSKDWQWNEQNGNDSVNYMGSYSHIKVVGYWNYNSNQISTIDVSTSNNNTFSNESYSEYWCPIAAGSTIGAMRFYNDGGDRLTMTVYNREGYEDSNMVFTYLGYYYWG